MDKTKRIGRFIRKFNGEGYKCYVPNKLPFSPPLQLEKFHRLLEQANASLGKLDGVTTLLPNFTELSIILMKKEAILSSRIEGTQSSLSDFLIFEAKTKEQMKVKDSEDDIEIMNYTSAMQYGLEKVKELPLSRKLFCEIHKKLLSKVRGSDKTPGEFRTSQNWIGGTRPGNAIFVPPPPEDLNECFSDFEKFLNDKNIYMPTLIKVSLAHVQFETLHPFLDGNGRIGRLLITFMLCLSGLLKKPLLYISLYFNKHKEEYYNLLQSVRETGDWEAWVKFFLQGIIETASQIDSSAKKIISVFEDDAQKIKNLNEDTAGVLKAHACLQKFPVISVKTLEKESSVSYLTALRSLKVLERTGLVREITGQQRNKIFIYKNYIKILNQESY